jgi:hypothetical protein
MTLFGCLKPFTHGRSLSGARGAKPSHEPVLLSLKSGDETICSATASINAEFTYLLLQTLQQTISMYDSKLRINKPVASPKFSGFLGMPIGVSCRRRRVISLHFGGHHCKSDAIHIHYCMRPKLASTANTEVYYYIIICGV